MNNLSAGEFHEFRFQWTPPIAIALAFSIVTSLQRFFASMVLSSNKPGLDSPGFRNVNGYSNNISAGKK
jgi:hypothetical protein